MYGKRLRARQTEVRGAVIVPGKTDRMAEVDGR